MATGHTVPQSNNVDHEWLTRQLATVPDGVKFWPRDRVATKRRMSTSGRTLRAGEQGAVVKIEGPDMGDDEAHRYMLVIKWDDFSCPAMLDAYYPPGPEPDDEQGKLRALSVAAHASRVGPKKLTDEFRAFPYQVRLVGRR